MEPVTRSHTGSPLALSEDPNLVNGGPRTLQICDKRAIWCLAMIPHVGEETFQGWMTQLPSLASSCVDSPFGECCLLKSEVWRLASFVKPEPHCLSWTRLPKILQRTTSTPGTKSGAWGIREKNVRVEKPQANGKFRAPAIPSGTYETWNSFAELTHHLLNSATAQSQQHL